MAAVPDALAAALALEPQMAEAARVHAAADRTLIIARGYEYATAREWAIKIKELAHVFADPYSAADFAHGPVALVEAGVPVIAIVRDGPTAAGLVEQLGRLRDGPRPGPHGPLGPRRRAGARHAADRPPRRGGGVGRARSPPSSPASSTRCT